MMAALLQMTLCELARAFEQKSASPVELIEEVFAALDRHNPTLNAVVAERDRALVLADARSAGVRVDRGEARPLEGIPFVVKDLEDAAGLTTTHGSKPFAESVATRDSTQVARLKAAGGILLGKTNAPEFGSNAITRNLVYGVTRSPWDPELTPGGSSGGSAAALAGELVPLVTASDGGGSIRIPASFVGAFGLKTSFGRIPNGPLHFWEHGATVVQGPLTKTVEDAALVLDQVSGYDPHDPRSLPRPEYSFRERLREPLSSKATFGISLDFGYVATQPDIAAVVEDAAREFERLGHRVVPISNGPPNIVGPWGLLTAFEIGGLIADKRPAREGEFGRGLLEVVRFAEGMSQRVLHDISEQRVAVVNWCAETFSKVDFLLTPTVPFDPPPARGPFPSEMGGRALPTGSVAAFTVPFNMAWHPAASVRAGLSRRGLPVGMQIVAPHHQDDLALRAAYAFEQRRPWHSHWPLRSA